MATTASDLYEQQKKRTAKRLKSKHQKDNDNVKRHSYSTRSLKKWLKENNLTHLHDIIASSHISIEDLSQSNEVIIRDTAYYKLKLRGKDLSSFVYALIRYNNMQCLTQRSNEVLTRINNLEFAKHEMQINESNDIQYIRHKIEKLIKTLKKREQILIGQMKKSYLHKSEHINEQIDALQEYNDKIIKQKRLLLEDEMNSKIKINQNMNCKVLLNESTNFPKQKAIKMTKVTVEMPNYDALQSLIKKTGIISDEKHEENGGITLHCLCGTELILTNVAQCYDISNRDRIYCNFCNYHCKLPDDGEIYHCPAKDIKLHPGGFDLCFFCAAKCFEARKIDKKRHRDRMREEKRRKKAKKMLELRINQRYNRQTIDLGMSNSTYTRRRPNAHHVISPLPKADQTRLRRSQSAVMYTNGWADSVKDSGYVDGFLYANEVQRLVAMGYDYVRARKLVVKYSGNMRKVMQVCVYECNCF